MEDALDFEGEDPAQVMSTAVRLYSKDMAGGSLDKYQQLKAQLMSRAMDEECVPWEYYERATEVIKMERTLRTSKHRKLRALVLIGIGTTLLLMSGIIYIMMGHPPTQITLR